ncbi:flagellar hook-basal body protein [Sulfurospirillum sp. 1612]|uniref:flagellar hook-basal body protein n=1 Tax=Sulfurospirillum sp. 1612 TaxID=3094835 RepID=UPI002F93F8E1
MQSGYYDATGGMVTQFNRLDVISNNLANLNTTAFKKDKVIIGDFKRIFQETQDNMPIADNTKEAAKFLNSSIDTVPQISEQYTKFSQGAMKRTGNSLDFALKDSKLFFMVKTPNGTRLTQNGSFVINSNGNLTTKEGYPVLPSNYFQDSQLISIPQNAQITADQSGILYANGNPIGQLYIADTEDIKGLQKEGNNLYKFPDINAIKQSENTDAIAQGFLESSNVNPVTEMVHLIEANRMVEMYQKVMNSHMNDLNTDAINKLASVSA